MRTCQESAMYLDACGYTDSQIADMSEVQRVHINKVKHGERQGSEELQRRLNTLCEEAMQRGIYPNSSPPIEDTAIIDTPDDELDDELLYPSRPHKPSMSDAEKWGMLMERAKTLWTKGNLANSNTSVDQFSYRETSYLIPHTSLPQSKPQVQRLSLRERIQQRKRDAGLLP